MILRVAGYREGFTSMGMNLAQWRVAQLLRISEASLSGLIKRGLITSAPVWFGTSKLWTPEMIEDAKRVVDELRMRRRIAERFGQAPAAE